VDGLYLVTLHKWASILEHPLFNNSLEPIMKMTLGWGGQNFGMPAETPPLQLQFTESPPFTEG
jgi:hypothetical protein